MASGGPMASQDMNSQAFWNEFMRRPDAKAAYQQERKLQMKKQAWLEEKMAIEENERRRKLLADKLDEAPADLKKLIAPMFHIRVVEHFLWMLYDECQKNDFNFLDKLRDVRAMSQLMRLRENFEAGGEERMAELEKQWFGICTNIHEDNESKKIKKPANADMYTLKQVLEFAQECKREGNEKFKEGLYEEALFIYSQGDDMMKKWTVDKHMKNEHKWLKDYHIACLKNKAQAALKLERFQTALDAAVAALAMDEEDHKAWYRKVLAEKGLGKFKEAEASLSRLEEIAQWCPDRQRILKDCEAERKRLQVARAKNKTNTKDMLGKAFQSGIFSGDREKELEEATKQLEAPSESAAAQVEDEKGEGDGGTVRPLERNIQLTPALCGDLVDELCTAYGQRWFQERVRKCARDSGFERSIFLTRLKGVAFEVQKPVLEKWGFEGSEHGVREMTAAIRDHTGPGKEVPEWLRKKQERCRELLYGGKEGGMLDVLT